MTENHIAGPLTVGESVVDTETAIQEIIINSVIDGKECYPFVAIEFKNMPGMQQANARRAVACWNACQGISTENLEDNVPVRELVSRYNAALRRCDQLLAALQQAQRAINSMKVEAETGAQGDEQMMLEAASSVSKEGLDAGEAIRELLEKIGVAP